MVEFKHMRMLSCFSQIDIIKTLADANEETDMTKRELLKKIGSVEQVGGVRDFTFNDGRAKGVRAIEINTGKLRFTILPDRCMDIAQADFKGESFAWISKAGIVSPAYYEKDGSSWLRGFFGGLMTTCGLRNIGRACNGHGLHGRIANIAASKVSVFADWVGDEYVMRVSGEMRESSAMGENLVLKRTISTKLFSSEIEVEDTVVNEGYYDVDLALAYHCNFGYPLVDEGSKIVGVPEEFSNIWAPVHTLEEECITVKHEGEIGWAGIENGKIGAYITYKRDTMPDFLIWKMLGESDYVIGLEPRTTALGGASIAEQGKYYKLKPFEEYKVYLRFDVKEL